MTYTPMVSPIANTIALVRAMAAAETRTCTHAIRLCVGVHVCRKPEAILKGTSMAIVFTFT